MARSPSRILRAAFVGSAAIATAILMLPAVAYSAPSGPSAARTTANHKAPPAQSHRPTGELRNRKLQQPHHALQASQTANNGSSALDLVNHGGPIMPSTTTFTIFWLPPGHNTVSTNYASLMNRYLQDVGGSPLYNILTQYPGSNGNIANSSTFGGTWTDTTAFPAGHDGSDDAHAVTDGDIRDEVTRALSNNPSWGPADLTKMYFVFTGSGVVTCKGTGDCSDTTYCAYHNAFNGDTIYGSMPYDGDSGGGCYAGGPSPNNDTAADAELSSLEHEHFEAVNDPHLNAWFNSNGDEIGDICNRDMGTRDSTGANLYLNGHPYEIQREYSNADSACVKSFGATSKVALSGSLDFGTVPRGSSATRSVTVSNTGTATLDVLDVAMDSGSDPAFSVLPNPGTPQSLAPGSSIDYTVKFAPPGNAASGTRNGTLKVTTTDLLAGVSTLPATGKVGAPTITVSPAILDFGTVPRGTAAHLTVTVHNNGDGDLTVNGLSFTGDPGFSIEPQPGTPQTVPPGSTVDFTATFTSPANSGAQTSNAILHVASDDPGTPDLQVPATASIGAPHAVLSPGPLSFPDTCRNTTSSLTETVTNNGTADLTVTAVTVTGPDASSFTVLNAPPPATVIHPGSSFAYTVAFTPTSGGAKTATLTVSSDDPDNPQLSAQLSGVAAVPAITLGSSAISYGGLAVDNRTAPHAQFVPLPVFNESDCDLTISSLVVTGADFSLAAPPGTPFVIGKHNSITLSVGFDPTVGGGRTGSLAISSDDPANPTVTVALSGPGLLPAIGTSSDTIFFPPTVVEPVAGGLGGSTANLTVTNTGQAELIVDSLNTSGAPYFAPGASSPPNRYAPSDGFVEPITFHPSGAPARKVTGTFTIADNGDPAGGASKTVNLCGEAVGRGIRVLVVDNTGAVVPNVAKLHLQLHKSATNLSISLKDLGVTTVAPPTSCQTFSYQYENQDLPATDTVNQQGSYYTLDVTAGGKSTTVTFTLGTAEFQTLVLTVK
ncbi:MAG: choice-of-anchor D domain-containing protein [Micromonosporaceae bacterium]|nr:choice-of-anchor D domain-containing protein [Micromonosporaceae bacterium]